MSRPVPAAAANDTATFPELLRGDAARFAAYLEEEIQKRGTPTREEDLQKLVVELLRKLHRAWSIRSEDEVPVPTKHNRNRKGKFDVLIRHEQESCVIELKYVPAKYYRGANREIAARKLAYNERDAAVRIGDDVLRAMTTEALLDCCVQLASHVPPEVTRSVSNGEKVVPEESRHEVLVACHMHGQQCKDFMETATAPPALMPLKPEVRSGRKWTPFVYRTSMRCVVESALEQARVYQGAINPRPSAAVALVGFGPRVVVGAESSTQEKAPEKKGPLDTIGNIIVALSDEHDSDGVTGGEDLSDEDPEQDGLDDTAEEEEEDESE